ncbi:hypothetical protein [Vibrio mediterranei]|uniref:Uncharacterized protein n=1 Tax=Vibrio mediterranei TaxID=689 RepID=A0ABX5D624_9VIBR|nr:hypothetical protein [Vibrio mediterranei]MCG9659936.1 hypothetical protein [Vibrio mediterranei]PRQ65125.1 hypothetical protein COR51_23680 [Vibrio mediterranei]
MSSIKPKCNLDVLTNLCNEHSPMAQAFIAETCITQAERVIKQDAESGKPDNWPEIISWNEWVNAARSVVDEFAKLNRSEPGGEHV